MFSFIILHYKNIDDTIECLTKLKKFSNNDSHLIVVDNNTLNLSDENKIKEFTTDIIKLDSNLGFAKANNIGIKYAKEKYNSKFYIVINNDVFIDQMDFFNVIVSDYNKYNFDLLGPRILSPTGESVNPFPVIDINNINGEIKKCKKLIKIYSSRILYILLRFYLNIKYSFKKVKKPTNGLNIEKNIPLHGCALIFSLKYIEKYEYPFYNDTFLFHEEEFLYYRIVNDKLISIYDPNLEVFHREGSSIKKNNKGKRLSKLFREKERLKSLKILKYEVEGEKNE